MVSPVRLPVVCLSVTLVHPTQAVEIFGNISTAFVRWPSADIQENVHGDRPRGTTASGELNTTGVAKSILDLSKAMSQKRCMIEGKLN